ncbi:restriction endonuclease subunit S [Mammaliicoccus lentus]|uniref:restriction endonuclease subunit S n=1 Tax=Mammaliicoccus TaxID=2803850 RepID=UPI001AAD85C7|nr:MULTISPECIES: restriction endonuclease subunit S [Mammaliicoccus]MBO3077565.1 restriction endonuclease subunit S [Mammaliicoccus vitulinus]MCR1871971.1 restriction endonuclease subunit S [Mammaliicoccus lentus]
MTNDVKKVPELRFPEFNEDWNERTLSDSIKILKSGLSRELSTTDIGLPVIRANNLQNYNLVLDDIKYWFKEDPKGAKTENYYLEKNDILVNFINSEAKMGTSCIIKSDFKRDTIYTTNILRYVTKEAYDSYFHYIYTQTYNYKKWIKIITKPAVNQASFTTVDFKKIPYYIPEFKEQQKIGEFFSKLDRQIELEEQKLAKLEEQKKVYMQKIFSQQLRFKDENGNDYPKWENKQLGNLVDITMGQSPSSKNYTENSNYTTLVQGNADLNNGYIEPRIYTKQITKLAEVNDILLTVRAPVGKIGRAQLKACIGRGVCAIKGDSFIYYFLELFDLQNKWIRFSQGSTFESISGNEIKNIDIAYPVNEERQKISEFLSKLDKLLKNQLLKVEQLKQRKQGLLQKMFI